MMLLSVILLLCLAVATNGEVEVVHDDVYWAGGDGKTLDESSALCASVSHGMLPSIWSEELMILHHYLYLKRSEEHWVSSKLTDGKFYWEDGSRMDDYQFEGGSTCSFPRCGVTVRLFGGRDMRLNVRNAEDKYRTLCRLTMTAPDALPHLRNLWQLLSESEQATVASKLAPQIVHINSQRIKDLEKEISDIRQELKSRH